MFAISFDMIISDLKTYRDIRGFKVENWSNFTDIVKNS